MPPKLGQHFLKNKSKLEKISATLSIKRGDFIIEIGPGHGALTRLLINRGATIAAVEKDPNLAAYIYRTFGDDLKVIRGDILKELPQIIPSQDYKLVGNIPYYLTGRLLRLLSLLPQKPSLTVLTIQKEVALKITSPESSLLSAIINFWGEPVFVSHIPKSNFSPSPRVDSAIIKITKKPDNNLSFSAYEKFIKGLFKQPRQTLRNNLKKGLQLSDEHIIKLCSDLNIAPSLRPSALSSSEILTLFQNYLKLLLK